MDFHARPLVWSSGEVCAYHGLKTLAAPNISSGGSVNQSDHNAEEDEGGWAQTLSTGSQDPHHQVSGVYFQGQGKQVGGVLISQGKF